MESTTVLAILLFNCQNRRGKDLAAFQYMHSLYNHISKLISPTVICLSLLLETFSTS